MFYLGGKARIGRAIACNIVANISRGGRYLEPFVGGGSVVRHMTPHFSHIRVGDVHWDLVLLWRDAARGWIPPDRITEDDYHRLQGEEPSALRGFAGFVCSYGGKWFGGYARQHSGSDGGYNFAAANVPHVVRTGRSLVRAEIACRSWNVRKGDIVYADPPYAGTTPYHQNGFDHAAFWRCMTAWRNIGASVFVSEYTAPDPWRAVWSAPHIEKFTQRVTTERLFAIM